MQRYYDVVLDQYGNPASGVVVYVYDAGTTTPSSLYLASEDGLDPVNPISNPIVTDSSGVVAFAVATGRYTITYSGSNITPRQITWMTLSDGTGGGSSAWGGITGTLSNQTDLQTALNAKLDTATAATTYLSIATAATTYAPLVSPSFSTSATFGFLTQGRVLYAGVGGALTDSANLTYSSAQFKVADATAATSTTSGALVVTGGAGIGGALWTGSKVNIAANGGLSLADGAPAVTTTTLYNVGGSLYWAGSGLATVAGADTNVQFNSSGAMAGTSTFKFAPSTRTLTLGTTSGSCAFTLLNSAGTHTLQVVVNGNDVFSGRTAGDLCYNSSNGSGFWFGQAGTWIFGVDTSNIFYVSTQSKFTTGSASTSATTGAVVITGGLGVGGAVFSNGAFNSRQAVAATSTDGLVLATTATATAGNQKYSPAIHMTGSGWKTDATAAAQSVDWRLDVQPVQGTANPLGMLSFAYSVNGGAYTTKHQIAPDGQYYNNGQGFSIGTYGGNNTIWMYSSGLALASNAWIAFTSGYNNALTTQDIFIMRDAAATLRFGSDPSATPVAQTLSVQDASGTNLSGALWTFRASRGTGSGTNTGNLFAFDTPNVGTSGTTLQTTTTKVAITGDGNLVLPKTSGTGIKVEPAAPTFGWHDLLGEITVRGTGAADPTWSTYIGNIRQYQFTVNDEVWTAFHVPHDYAPGTDMYIHAHWSHSSTTVAAGTVSWAFDVTSAKGHNQAAFGTTVTATATQTASTTRYQHMIAEVQLSSSSPTGSQINNSTLEVDSLILVRCYLSANSMTGTVEPFLHCIDIHYQSTGIPTKAKAPNFYT